MWLVRSAFTRNVCSWHTSADAFLAITETQASELRAESISAVSLGSWGIISPTILTTNPSLLVSLVFIAGIETWEWDDATLPMEEVGQITLRGGISVPPLL